jgi:hypothetical protein
MWRDGCGFLGVGDGWIRAFVGTRTRHRARGVGAHDFLVSRNLSPFLRVPSMLKNLRGSSSGLL